jgi:DNA-binding transcriptional MerR regulator
MGITTISPGQLFTTKQVAERLGLQRHQIEYRIDRGIIPDSELRICGRRLFTEREVQTIEAILRGDKTHD